MNLKKKYICILLCSALIAIQQANSIELEAANKVELVINLNQKYNPPTPEVAKKTDSIFFSGSNGKKAMGVATLGYCYILMRLLYSAHTLFSDDSWALWRADVSLYTLYQLPQKKVAQELATAIEKYYRQHTNPVQAVAQFMHDVEIEKTKLKQFFSLHEWLDALLIGYFFPSQKATITKAYEHLDRLNYLKQVIWLCDPYTQPNTAQAA